MTDARGRPTAPDDQATGPAADLTSVVPPAADPFVARSTEKHTGPVGVFARTGRAALTPAWVLTIVTVLTYLLGYLADRSCWQNNWTGPDVFEHLCYTDITPLYGLRGIADAIVPYVQTVDGIQPLEYPVGTGAFIAFIGMLTALLAPVLTSVGWPSAVHVFYDLTVVGLGIGLVGTVLATAGTVRRRPWDALLIAGSPIVLLAATINWDLLALAATAAGLLAWSRRAAVPAGVLLGIAIAVKFYPVVLLGAFVLLAVRTGRWRPVARMLAATVGTWLAVNAAVAVAGGANWAYFYTFSRSRVQDLGSVWLGGSLLGLPDVPADALNVVAMGVLALLVAGIGYTVLAAPHRPRVAQVAFLLLVAFVLTNKVYSPQYALWLLPLAVLARPRWRDHLVWQGGQIVYIVAVWWYLVGQTDPTGKGLPPAVYGMAIGVHVLATVFLATQVLRDMWDPRRDPVRTDGFADDRDDPAGGVFDRAPDTVRWQRWRPVRVRADRDDPNDRHEPADGSVLPAGAAPAVSGGPSPER